MGNTQDNINWELLAKFFSGDASKNEADELMKWTELDEENKKLFEKAENDLKLVDSIESSKEIDSKLAWEILEDKLKKDGLLNRQEKRVEIRLNKFLRVAAIIVLTIGLGVGTYKTRMTYFKKVVSTTQNDYKKNILLSDGSVVYLNSNSKIIYPREFSGEKREVYLKQGEAFFKVSKNQDKPFVVITENAEVKVLGTSFNVNLRSEDTDVEVFVETGKVQLNKRNSKEEKVLIDPGFIGTLSNHDVNMKVNKDSNYMSWKTRYLIFNEENLDKVVNTINRVYDSKISLGNSKLHKYRLTSTFDNQSIELVLEVLSTTFQLDVENTGSEIILKSKSI